MGYSRYDIFSYNPKLYDFLEIDKLNVPSCYISQEEEKESSEGKYSDVAGAAP